MATFENLIRKGINNQGERIEFPIIIEKKSSLQTNILRLILLCFLGYFMIVFPISLIGNGNFNSFIKELEKEPAIWILVALVLASLLLFLFGIFSNFYNYKIIRITLNEVDFYERKFPFPTKKWIEPISQYLGLMKIEHYSRRKHDHTVWFCVLLKHKEKRKNVVLVYSFDETTQRRQIEQIALALKMPILKKDGKEYIVDRKPESINKTLSEETVSNPESNALNPVYKTISKALPPYAGKSYKVTEGANELIVDFRLKWGKIIGLIAIATGVSMLVAKYFFRVGIQEGMAIVFIIIGSIFSIPHRELLRVTSRDIRFSTHNMRTFGNSEIVIPIAEVEEVKIEADASKGTSKKLSRTVKIISDKQIISFGYWSKESDKQWLANRLKELISAQQQSA